MRLSKSILQFISVVFVASFTSSTQSAEIVRLTQSTYRDYVPQGKEVDAIYGDFLLRNESIVAVIANPISTRNANMMTRNVGGCLIDLTTVEAQSDQLSAFYAGSVSDRWEFGSIEVAGVPLDDTTEFDQLRASGSRVTITFRLAGKPNQVERTVRYSLEDGSNRLLIQYGFENTSQSPTTISHSNYLRMDQSRDGQAIELSQDGESNNFWIYDDWFNQAYVVSMARGAIQTIRGKGSRSPVQLVFTRDGSSDLQLTPLESVELIQYITPAPSLLEALSGQDDVQDPMHVHVLDNRGVAIEGAFVDLESSGVRYGWGRTPRNGMLSFHVPTGQYKVTVKDIGRGEIIVSHDTSRSQGVDIVMTAPGFVSARITDSKGGPIPCKVQFFGRFGAPDPFFGPDSGSVAIHNVRYTEDGTFTQNLPAGRYDVVVSYGNEYDALFDDIVVHRGKGTVLEGELVRVVDSTGWVSADFHSHSTPSGDNTSSQFGRVLNLLAEHVEFAPCTEHNRIDTYRPHLQRLNAEALLATCVGLELTSSPGGLNHQNAFPLHYHPHMQDGGAPLTHANPELQIERLALWDDNSEKLVQQNHPDMPRLFFDSDGDKKLDNGLERMYGHMDVIEIHPLGAIFWYPLTDNHRPGVDPAEPRANRILTWLQLWNMGRGVPGVVNTDAHANFHGSGWIRNYIKSSTDDPSRIETLEMVRASERGNLTMTNGPFLELEAWLESDTRSRSVPGDTLYAKDGKVQVRIRIQCANWLDVDRVQILLNGRYSDEHNFTRDEHPNLFQNDVTKFDQTLSLSLSEDTHIVVATIGEGMNLGPVVGSKRANGNPVALTNPLFVDVDGNGFEPNGDDLGIDPTLGR